ncbi:MAG: L,D-transpeptidase [Clostridia bacterium]|nr:L,D-transpeptidase [Clostridia bacterium]
MAAPKILIEKSLRRLTLLREDGPAFSCPIALGSQPVGHKARAGDGKTPEGQYAVCLIKERGKFGPSLGLSYPSLRDARAAVLDDRLDPALLPLFEAAERTGNRPPWGTPLGGEIYIHGGGASSDWTAGCVALHDDDMAALFPLCPLGTPVEILP